MANLIPITPWIICNLFICGSAPSSHWKVHLSVPRDEKTTASLQHGNASLVQQVLAIALGNSYRAVSPCQSSSSISIEYHEPQDTPVKCLLQSITVWSLYFIPVSRPAVPKPSRLQARKLEAGVDDHEASLAVQVASLICLLALIRHHAFSSCPLSRSPSLVRLKVYNSR